MELRDLLSQFQQEKLSIDETLDHIQQMLQQSKFRIDDLGMAKLDIDREKRTGFPEIIFGEGKTTDQIVSIMDRMYQHTGKVIATRVDEQKAEIILNIYPEAKYHPLSRTITWFKEPLKQINEGYISVLSAGTSDQPVAEEAAVIAKYFGNHVETIYDIGVSGIHRVFAHLPVIENSNAVIVVAGMEGALASVIGGLVSKPVIAVPTSQGYGANFQGLASLLSMLNACAPGVTVVNIDNGFGAGYYASLINKQMTETANRNS